MLCELAVSNLLIVERARLVPEQGLTVITGETGAGKSLLLDALGLLLGGKGGARLIGPHGDVCQVSAVFHVEQVPAIMVEQGMDLDDGGGVVLRRRLYRNGRSQAWVNDVPVSIQVLRSLGRDLVEIRVQQEHLRLAERARQMYLLDVYGGHDAAVQAYARAHQRCLALQAELEALQGDEREGLRELDFLRFMSSELEALDPHPGEYEALDRRQRLLSGARHWRAVCEAMPEELIDGDRAVVPVLGRLAGQLSEAPDDDLIAAGQQLATAAELVREAAYIAARIGETMEVDAQALAEVDERLGAYVALMRKHGGTESALLAERQRLVERIDALEHVAERHHMAIQELEEAVAARQQAGVGLAEARREAYASLQYSVQRELADLGMPKARLLLHEATGVHAADALGTIMQEIHVQTNPGLPPGSLRDVPSGGESARLTLAMAVALADKDDTPVLVFDEVDSGVGGRLGAVIGDKLAALGRHRTVLAVTHVPQVAARATRQYVVRKQQADDRTVVTVEELATDARIGEIADMLGGGREAVAQARSLMAMSTQ